MMFEDVINKKHLMFDSMHYGLDKLSKDEIYSLMKDYYEGMKIKELLKKYSLDVKITNIVPYFPDYKTDIECPYCQGYMTASFVSRANEGILKIKKCSICSHTLDKNCRCKTCREIEQSKQERLYMLKNNMLKELIVNELEKETIAEKNLNMRQRLYLASVLHCGLTEDTMNLNPIDKIIDYIGPNFNYTIDIFKYLYNTNVILIDEKSPLEAFTYNLNDEIITSFSIDKVVYRLNIKPYENNYGHMIKRLLYPDESLFNNEFCYELWKEINLAETIQYFKPHMNKVKFNTEIGEKTRRTFERIVDNFSLSEIFYIIQKSIANGTKLYQSGEYTKTHAINIVKREISNYSERVLANKWSLTGYNRDYNLPESMLSKILFNNIMKIDYLGFRTPPTKQL
ncbi:hypothetical protein PYL43_04010 [Staphylococcus epidermidis]|nr:hypothetical protein [Staphylococcus epidermidis]